MTLEPFANLMGVLGTCALAVPSFTAARLVLLIKRGEGLAKSIPADQKDLKQWTNNVNNTLEQIRGAWRTREAIALFGGLFLTLLSYLLPFARQMTWI